MHFSFSQNFCFFPLQTLFLSMASILHLYLKPNEMKLGEQGRVLYTLISNVLKEVTEGFAFMRAFEK